MNDNSAIVSPWGNTVPGPRPTAPIDSPIQAVPEYPLVYDGKLGELYAIFLRNLLLILATGGVYYFWGKVRLRQYLWSRFSFLDDRFEFSGRGLEMFLGFLMVIGGLFIWGVATTAVELSLESDPVLNHGGIATITFIIIFYLAFVAQFSAQRYRLTRTRWRGIGGGMRGSSLVYALKACLLMLLLPISLFLARPYVALKLLRHRIERTSIGDRPLRMDYTPAAPLLGRYVLCGILAIILAGVIGFFLVQGIIARYAPMLFGALGFDLVLPIVTYGVFYLVSAWVMASFWALYWRHVAEHIRWGDARFRVSLQRKHFARFRVWHMLALIFSFGLAYPWVVHHSARILAANVVVLGQVDPETLRQTDLSGAAIGEGLVNAFDPGFI
jgi:uncharacterized membrane protein YjgN (DUF898 family)